jgi:cephalosporin hydroxylase
MAEVPTPQSSAPPERVPDLLPVPFQGPGVVGALTQMANGLLRGWVYIEDQPEPVSLAIFEGEHCLLTLAADQWRDEKARLRAGNGYCGFEVPVPDAICDGRLHEVDFRIAGSTQSLLARPLRLLPGRRPASLLPTRHAAPGEPDSGERKPHALKLSIIVNFYNMQREAARTLTSLSRGYQRGIGDLEYEVLCIDNGSNPPLDADWIASFGPEFRLFTPSKLLPSPSFAINEAARAARGEYLAIMIDGAHLLTPGVFAEAMAALAESPSALVAVRYWFVGGDQRWLHAAGYTREMEDKIFERIHWPKNGYLLFSMGAPIGESPTAWLDSLIESNCMFIPAEHYHRIGGMDEDFSEPGGGFTNLDLFRRAAATADSGVVSLIGEASFHQYHEGTTTNVSDEAKDARVRAYSNKYRELRGVPFLATERQQFRFRGSIKIDDAVRALKSSSMALGQGITDRIRPGLLYASLTPPIRRFLQMNYVESGLHRVANWRGKPVGVAPADLVNFQEIIRTTQPDCIVLSSPEVGLMRFLDDMLQLYGLHKTRIVRVATVKPPGPGPARVRTVVGKHLAPETLARIRSEIGGSENVMVLYAPEPGVGRPYDALVAFSKFVSLRSYLIFLGTVLGQPWLGYSRNWFQFTIQKFLPDSGFKIDAVWDQEPLTACYSGYLRRVEMAPKKYDPSLDQLDTFESTPA